MRYALGLLLLFLVGIAHAGDSGQQRAEAAGRSLVGTPAPAMVLKTIDGQTIDLAQLYGKKAVYLKFWATWCIPCREQMPHLERTYEEAGPDMAVIAIDVGFDDSVEEVRKYRRGVGLTMPIVFDDGTLGEAFRLRVTPQHVVIGRDGRVLYVGHEANARLDAALQAARTASPLPPTSPIKTSTADPKPIGVGDTVPDVTVRTLTSKDFRLRDPRPTVLVFLSPWCESYLAKSRPQLSQSCRDVREQADALARSRADLRWLGVASGLWAARDDLIDYQRTYRVGIPLTLDDSGQLFRSFRVMHVPTVLLVDAQGKVIRRIEGVQPELASQLPQVSLRTQSR
ncbi:MAG TPA: TlpA disulfide reductase family protein [Dyella sp.]|uniref:TlpA family protein disulfide reductase n=1 Tax=Dyella sp. TaxID=1869338 RepID=UPI002F946B4B